MVIAPSNKMQITLEDENCVSNVAHIHNFTKSSKSFMSEEVAIKSENNSPYSDAMNNKYCNIKRCSDQKSVAMKRERDIWYKLGEFLTRDDAKKQLINLKITLLF